MVRVSITAEDLALANKVADFRLGEKLEGRWALPKSDEGRASDLDTQRRQYVEGALCEIVVGKYLGEDVYADWLANRAMIPGGGLKVPCDLGAKIQVRQTTWGGPGAKLIRHKSEPADDKVFVLCVARLEDMSTGRSEAPPLDYVRIVGWCYASDIDEFDAADDPNDKTGLSRAAFTLRACELSDPLTIPKDAVRCSPPSPSSCSGATRDTSRGVYESGPSDTYESELLQASASRGAPQN